VPIAAHQLLRPLFAQKQRVFTGRIKLAQSVAAKKIGMSEQSKGKALARAIGRPNLVLHGAPAVSCDV
jgi:hypothetical protein